MKKQCAYSGASLQNLGSAPEVKDTERGQMVACPGCGRELKVTRAGLAGATGAIPQHKDFSRTKRGVK